MDKSKKILLGLLAVSVGLLAAFLILEQVTLDRDTPVISCPEAVLDASVAVTEEQLLEGVTALDDHDGDLTGDVVVEALSAISKDHTRQVTYAVMDLAGNVGRAHRTIHYTDYQPPRIQLSSALRTDDISAAYGFLEHLQASSVLDGDLSSSIKYSFSDGTPVNGIGHFPIEFRVNDSAGRSTAISTEIEVYDGREETIQIQLKQYILYLPVNSQFDPDSFYLSANRSGKLSISSDVNPSVPGVYHVHYLVENPSGDYGKSTLIVVVEQ